MNGHDGFWAASMSIANAISEHDFSLRQRLALDLVRKLSFGAGRTEAYVPGLRFFERAMRVTQGNVSMVLSELKRMNVLEEAPEYFYGFRMPIDAWLVPRRTEEIEVITQLELLEPPPYLQSALRLNFVEGLAAEYHTKRDGQVPPTMPDCASEASRPIQTPVSAFPESGRAGQAGDGFPNREGPNPFDKIREAITLPESGTALAMQQCSNAVEKQQNYIVTSLPKSGSPARKGAFDPERQALFDDLKELGAFGPQNASRPYWWQMVWDRPNDVREAIGDYRYALKTRPGWTAHAGVGAWMNDKLKRWKNRT